MSPSRSRSQSGPLDGQGMPQVNLLPPSVRAARGLKVVGRWLAIYGVVVVVVLAAVYALAFMQKADADQRLADAQDETRRLAVEQAKYAEVPIVLGELANAKNALVFGTSTEILWEPYLKAINAVLPKDVSVDSLTITGASPIQPPEASGTSLYGGRAGSAVFVLRAKTPPDIAKLITAFNSVPGFADTFIADSTVAEADDDRYYVVNGSVQFTEQAWAKRFASVPVEGEEG